MKLSLLVRVLFVLIAAPYILVQVRKPSKWIGRFFTWMMNLTHSSLSDWGLTHVSLENRSQILDIGCGGGRTIQKLAGLAPMSRIFGVDYAAGSVAASRSKNADLIAAGRVEIIQASVSELPFPDEQFDLVTAFETHYYWPSLKQNMTEVLRTLKPGGSFLLVAESYKKSANSSWQQPALKLLGTTLLTAGEHRTLLLEAGYADVQVTEDRNKGWLCVTGHKNAIPMAAS